MDKIKYGLVLESLGFIEISKQVVVSQIKNDEVRINANDINMAAVAAMNAPRAYAFA